MSEAAQADLTALWVTASLALGSVVILLLIATPLARALALARGPWKSWAEAVVALPLVLPPTVMGFYLLVLMSPSGWLGAPWIAATGAPLAFSFEGLLIASCVSSLPFAVQPLQNAFEAVGVSRMEAASSLRASPWDAFFSVMVPLSVRGYVTAAVLVFAHTLGEFGVLFMVGGAIPGETKVASIAIFEHVESFDYAAAHRLAAVLTLAAFTVLAVVYWLNRRIGRPAAW